jgi:hypothetical protein
MVYEFVLRTEITDPKEKSCFNAKTGRKNSERKRLKAAFIIDRESWIALQARSVTN